VRFAKREARARRGAWLAEELQAFAQLGHEKRTLVLLDVRWHAKRGSASYQWCDIDFGKRTLNIESSIWNSIWDGQNRRKREGIMRGREMITDLLRWPAKRRYAKEGDWIFASNV